MDTSKDSFKIVVPAQITKGDNGKYKIRGLASTNRLDREGEVILPEGIDLTPIDRGMGTLSWEHKHEPENIVGLINGYSKVDGKVFIEGELFKHHDRANGVRQVMKSLEEAGSPGRMGLSIEGRVVRRNRDTSSIVEACVVDSVALTMNPVNTDTHASLIKSMSASGTILDFQSTEEKIDLTPDTASGDFYTSKQVVDLLVKALGIGAGSLAAPADRSGGDALVVESFGTKKKKKKKKDPQNFEKSLENILDQLQVLYPEYSREVLWGNMHKRILTEFPES